MKKLFCLSILFTVAAVFAECPNEDRSYHTVISDGAIETLVFHNLECRKNGKYKDIAWPEKEIAVQLQYMAGIREVFREQGFDKKSSKEWCVRIYGFETNFPKGHVDFPPHFHIMLGFPVWKNEQVSHYYVTPEGCLTSNAMLEGYEPRATKEYLPGEWTSYRLPGGELLWESRILPDETGIAVRFPKGAEYTVKANAEGADVFCGEKKWCHVSLEDDVLNNVMTITRNGVQNVLKY